MTGASYSFLCTSCTFSSGVFSRRHKLLVILLLCLYPLSILSSEKATRRSGEHAVEVAKFVRNAHAIAKSYSATDLTEGDSKATGTSTAVAVVDGAATAATKTKCADNEDVACILTVAARRHRAVIRAHLGYADREGEAARWLDAILGFPSARSRKVAAAKLVDAIHRKRKFTVGVMGISTTAGHDNYYNQSYSKVFERHLGTVLAEANIKLEVRNHAVGGFGVMPSHLCVHTMVGRDLDLLTWDFQMMAPRGDCIVENFARAALNMPTRPAIMFWQGGVWLPKNGKFDQSNVRPIKSNIKQSCGGKWMVDWYADLGSHYGDLASVLQYLRYKGEHPALEDGTDSLFLDPEKGKRPSTDLDEPPFDAWKLQEQGRRRLARHHPGPTLHRIWGLAWAHAYLGLLIEGLETFDQSSLVTAVLEPPPEIKVKGCKPSYCKDIVPICSTTLLPRVEGAAPFLESMVVGKNKWRMVDGDGRAGVNKKFGYVDGKKALNGDVASGPLQVRFTTTEDKLPLAICQVPCPWGRCKGGRVILEGNAAFMLDEVELPPSGFATAASPGPYKVLVQKDMCFVIAKEVSKGTHTLTITPTAPEGSSIIVSHLIYF